MPATAPKWRSMSVICSDRDKRDRHLVRMGWCLSCFMASAPDVPFCTASGLQVLAQSPDESGETTCHVPKRVSLAASATARDAWLSSWHRYWGSYPCCAAYL